LARSPCSGGLEYPRRSPASHKRRRKGAQCPGVKLDHSIPEGYKCGNLALQVERVSDEKVYGYAFCAILTNECKLQTRPLVREDLLHEETRTC
jgi:hypothetical protein